MTPDELAAVRARDAAFPERTTSLVADDEDGLLQAMADRRALLAEVDRLADALVAIDLILNWQLKL